MSRVILVAESGADIPPSLAARYGIRIVPMHVSFGGESRDDGTFPAQEVCDFYRRTGILPKTSGSTPEDFAQVFDVIHAENPTAKILYLAYSSVTTCSFQSAQIAAEDRDYVTSIDTKAVAAGQCSIVIGTARQIEAHPDWGVEEATAAAHSLICRNRMCFVPGELEFLRAGGRVSNAAALCGKLLGIHPLIEILDGRLQATKKLRGKMEKLAPQLVEEYIAANDLERDELWLVNTPGLSEAVMAAAEDAAHRCGIRTVTWVPAGGVITTHGGPGALGIGGFTKDT